MESNIEVIGASFMMLMIGLGFLGSTIGDLTTKIKYRRLYKNG